MNTEFIKNGEQIVVAPKGVDYTLRTDITYGLEFDGWEQKCYLKESNEIVLPDPFYTNEDEVNFTKRVLNHFDTTKSNTVGVLLAGTKGTGKSVLTKYIAKTSKLPTIIVGETFRTNKLTEFFKNITVPVCIIFDEIDKNERYWSTEEMLKFLDGFESTCKKLVLMTCNNADRLNNNFFDRCSRIRYYRKYENNSNIVFIRNICNNEDVENIDELTNFISEQFKVLSFDNILSFIREVKNNPNIDYFDLVKDMNISIKGKKLEEATETTTSEPKEVEISYNTDCNECDSDCDGIVFDEEIACGG